MSENKNFFGYPKIKKFFSFLQPLASPLAIVALLCILMAAFFVVSQGVSAGDLGTQINGNLAYGTLTGLGTRDVRAVVMLIINIILGFVGLIFLCIMIYAGWVWMSSGGDPRKIDTARRTLVNATIGLVIIFMSYSIAAFLVRLFFDSAGPGGPDSPGAPIGACVNCGALGGGIIESVYPTPGSRDVPRDTLIFVTFKELMDDSTIINGAGRINDGAENIRISYRDPLDPSNIITLSSSQVAAAKAGSYTYVFTPTPILGDGVHNIWYSVRLGNAIEKIDNTSAFPGAGGNFTWSFEVGTRLDLVSPWIENVFPTPDWGSPDAYGNVPSRQAEWTLTLSSQPSVGQAAAVSPTTLNGTPGGSTTITGTYGCTTSDPSVIVTVSNVVNGAPVFQINTSVPEMNKSPIYIGGSKQIDIGCGLKMTFVNDPGAGNQWTFGVTAQLAPDTLSLNGKVFTFISGVPLANQIQRGGTLAATIQNISNADVSAQGIQMVSFTGTSVRWRATQAGATANIFTMSSSGSWANFTRSQDGTNAGFTQTRVGQSDQPKNVIIRVDFSESMLPVPISGQAAINDAADSDPDNGVGTLNGQPPFIAVQADLNGNGSYEANEFVGGVFEVSNLYKTVEFRSNIECDQKNSCGETIYCLPVRSGAGENVTGYKVTLTAASLQGCGGGCVDPNYPSCDAGICKSSDNTKNYPKAGSNNGIVDAANNSMDGDKDKNPEGQAQTHKIGQEPDGLNGDNATWEFFISNKVDLDAPIITAIGPDIRKTYVNTLLRPEALYNKLLMSSTLKPGTGYRDGVCSCGGAAGNACPTNQTCDTILSVCKQNGGATQTFCQSNSDCPTGHQCLNKSYVTLVDNACTAGSAQCVGWWIENDGVDSGAVLDGFDDQTNVLISHTPFQELTQYASDMASGIKDIYQNCYLPSSGPNATGGTCVGSPYCCDGVPSASACQ